MIRGSGPEKLLTTGAIRGWLAADTTRFVGPRVDDAMRWARERWNDSSFPLLDAGADDLGECQPDRMHALSRIIREDSKAKPARILAWYRLVDALNWGVDAIDEKVDLQCQLAYCISRQFRRVGDPASSWIWEGTCVQLAHRLSSVTDFLSLSADKLTTQLRDRFLSDPCVLLAFCAGLPSLLNVNSPDVLLKAASVHGDILRTGSLYLQPEERAWFLAELETIVAVGYKNCGRYSESEKWLDAAAKTCESIVGSDITLARIEFARRSMAYETRQWETARRGVESLAARFQHFGMHRYVARCTFVDAIAHKELGCSEKALEKLRLVGETRELGVEEWLRGLALVYAAEILASQGQDSDASKTLAEAWTLLKDSKVPSAIAHFHGVKGEILRDRGQLEPAIDSYRLAVSVYESAHVRAQEIMLRLILAETLLAAGRDHDAIEQIVTALPVIETLGMIREGVVAVALLRESLSRQEVNPEALRTLKRELQKLNKGDRS